MPHEFFELHAIKIYAHRTLAEALYIKRKHHKYICKYTWIHTEITINIYMQDIQKIPIKINIVITAHMITHKNKYVNNNASCKFIIQLAVILVIISTMVCRPSTNLPTLDHIVHHSQ
jgi:hypothetical protein